MAEPDLVNPAGAMSRLRRGRRNAVAQGTAEAAGPIEAPERERSKAERKRARAKPATRSRLGSFVRDNPRLVLALALLVIGVVLVILGWYGAAHTNILTEQIPYLISGGLLGMALIIVAGVVGSSASLSRENREMHRDLSSAIGSAPTGGPQLRSVPSPRQSSEPGRVHVVPGGHSYHEAGCPIIEGKQGSDMSREEAIEAGHTTCKLCGPD